MAQDVVAEFERYMARLGEGLGYSTRNAHLTEYCGGLMLPLKRKSVEPLAAEADPHNVPAKHQALLHFVGNAPWSDRALLDQIEDYVEPHLGLEQGAFWIVDDTGHRKYGSESVGVAHQYCGNLGKDDNCQVAVSLSLASARGSVPMDYRLYLPKSWAFDRQRRCKAHVPEPIVFQTKPEIALAQIEAAQERGVAPGVVIADAAYGSDTAWREALSERALHYAVGVLSSTTVWPPGVKPLPPARYCGRGIVPTKLRRGPGHEPMSVKALALQLKDAAWRRVTWREGTNKTLTSRFASVRVRTAHRDYQRSRLRAEEWLLIEWPRAEAEPIRYWLSSLPADTALERLVDTAKMRWRIEHDYHELKQEFGLSHYEGRGWRGFHHHATLCIAAYGFLTAQRLNEDSKKNAAARPKTSSLSKDHQPRTRRQSTAPRARLDSDAAISNRR